MIFLCFDLDSTFLLNAGLLSNKAEHLSTSQVLGQDDHRYSITAETQDPAGRMSEVKQEIVFIHITEHLEILNDFFKLKDEDPTAMEVFFVTAAPYTEHSINNALRQAFANNKIECINYQNLTLYNRNNIFSYFPPKPGQLATRERAEEYAAFGKLNIIQFHIWKTIQSLRDKNRHPSTFFIDDTEKNRQVFDDCCPVENKGSGRAVDPQRSTYLAFLRQIREDIKLRTPTLI